MVLAFAGTSAAHTPPPSFAADLDLRHESAAPDRVQSFFIFTRTDAFAELTRIELTPPAIAHELAERFAVNEKLASGPGCFSLQRKSNE